MNRHERYLYQLPPDWPLRSISEVGQVVGGGTPSRDVATYWAGGIPWATPTDMTALQQKVITTTKETITDSGLNNSGARLLPPGSVLVTTRASLGMVAVAGRPMTTNQGFKTIIPNREVDSGFLFHLLGQLDHELNRRASGTTFQEISGSEFGAIRIPCPASGEQTHIAEVLDTLDEAVERMRLMLEKRRDIAKGLVQRVFRHGDATEGLPPGWQVVNIGDLCKRVTDGTHQAVRTSRAGIPFLFVSCVRNGRILWDQAARISTKTYESISPGRVPTSDSVLYTAVGSYGHAAVVNASIPFGFQRHIAILYPDGDQLLPSYLAEWFNSDEGRRIADRVAIGNAQKTVTLGALGSFPIPIPSDVSVQNALIAPIMAARDAVQHLEQELLKLQTIKSGLTSDLLTGRVRIPEGVLPC